MQVLSRKDAANIGSHLYFTGEPCKHGHVAQRYTRTCVCTECHKTSNAKTMQRTTLVLQNVQSLTVRAHRDDHKAITDYAALLCAQRGLNVPQGPMATTPGQPRPTPATPPGTINPDVAARIAQTHAALTGMSPEQLKAVYVPGEFKNL